MAVDITKDPVYKDYIAKLQTLFGMDPTQTIDVNDPTTKLTMAVVLTTVEQGRNNYSYDQFVKGIAKSIGVTPDIIDKEVNPTSLGVENNTSSSGFVSPSSQTIASGGSSVPVTTSSIYVSTTLDPTIVVPSSTNSLSGFSTSIGPSGAVSTYLGSNISGSAPVYYTGTTGNYSAILNTIKTVEANGDYGAVNYTAVAVGYPKSIDTSNMTLSEVQSLQQQMLADGASSSAIGPYQTISSTLTNWAAQAGITSDTKMTPQVWDQIGAVGVQNALKATGGRIDLIPNVWYTGNAQGSSNVASPQAVADYRNKWNNVYAQEAQKVSPDSANQTASNSAPAGYENATVTNNSDGSKTYTNPNGQSTTVQPQAQVPNNATLPPNADHWVQRTDENGNLVFYATDSQGRFITADGSVAASASDALKVSSAPNNTAINSNGDIQVYALPDPSNKLTNPPSAVQAGVPDTWTQTPTYDSNGQFVSVKYTNPSNPNDFKVVDNNGNVFDQNGSTGANVLGTPYVITSVPSTQSLGLPDGTTVAPTVNNNNVIESVKYVTPDGTVRIVSGADGTVRDANGLVVGRVTGQDQQTQQSILAQLDAQNAASAGVTTITPDPQYNRIYTLQTEPQTATVQSVTPAVIPTSSNTSTASVSPQPVSIDPAIQQLQDKNTALTSEIATQQDIIDNPNSTPDQVIAAQQTLSQQLIPEQTAIQQKLSNPSDQIAPTQYSLDTINTLQQQIDSGTLNAGDYLVAQAQLNDLQTTNSLLAKTVDTSSQTPIDTSNQYASLGPPGGGVVSSTSQPPVITDAVPAASPTNSVDPAVTTASVDSSAANNTAPSNTVVSPASTPDPTQLATNTIPAVDPMGVPTGPTISVTSPPAAPAADSPYGSLPSATTFQSSTKFTNQVPVDNTPGPQSTTPQSPADLNNQLAAMNSEYQSQVAAGLQPGQWYWSPTVQDYVYNNGNTWQRNGDPGVPSDTYPGNQPGGNTTPTDTPTPQGGVPGNTDPNGGQPGGGPSNAPTSSDPAGGTQEPSSPAAAAGPMQQQQGGGGC